MYSKKYIRNFTEFNNLADVAYQRVNVPSPSPVKKQDEMISLIYAPDPVTGLPSSDVGMLLKHQDRPEIQRYIQQRLQISHESVRGADNPDDALTAIRAYKEDVSTYVQRMKDTFAPAVVDAGEKE